MKNRTFQGFLLFLALSYAYFLTLTLIYGSENLGLNLLCKWDCGWYKAIIRNGYISTIPPVPQQENISNVAFFPLYPAIGRMLGELLGITSDFALPLTSILFSIGTFLMLPSLVQDDSGRPDWKRLALLGAYPATFYLWVGYSESVYIFFLVLALLSFRMKSDYGPIFAVLSGVSMGLTRLTGFIIAGAVAGMMGLGWFFTSRTKSTFPSRTMLWLMGSIIGAGSFFLFCHLKFGAWNLYFQTLDIGWNKEFTISGFFSFFFRAIQKNIFPPWFVRDPVKMSWLINADLILLYSYVLFIESKAVWSLRKNLEAAKKLLETRMLKISLLIGGFTHLLITTIGDSGDWHRWGNGIRYSMPTFFLLVILWDKAWIPGWLESRPKLKQGLYYALIAFWVPYQLYYLFLYTRQVWVS